MHCIKCSGPRTGQLTHQVGRGITKRNDCWEKGTWCVDGGTCATLTAQWKWVWKSSCLSNLRISRATWERFSNLTLVRLRKGFLPIPSTLPLLSFCLHLLISHTCRLSGTTWCRELISKKWHSKWLAIENRSILDFLFGKHIHIKILEEWENNIYQIHQQVWQPFAVWSSAKLYTSSLSRSKTKQRDGIKCVSKKNEGIKWETVWWGEYAITRFNLPSQNSMT